jgi:hypothetical protein
MRAAMIEKFKAIEGTASDVRQAARSSINVNVGFGMTWGTSWDTSYECLFRISGAPVALRVSSPIFIEDGETVRVVGQRNSNGVFDAVAYYNQSSGASGSAKRTWSQWQHAIFCVMGGGLLALLVTLVAVFSGSLNKRPDPDDVLFINIAMGFVGAMGLALTLYGLTMFLRYRGEIRMIARMLNDA